MGQPQLLRVSQGISKPVRTLICFNNEVRSRERSILNDAVREWGGFKNFNFSRNARFCISAHQLFITRSQGAGGKGIYLKIYYICLGAGQRSRIIPTILTSFPPLSFSDRYSFSILLRHNRALVRFPFRIRWTEMRSRTKSEIAAQVYTEL